MEEQYHIWRGNVKITIDGDKQTEENIDKFETCKNRSAGEEDIKLKTCCSTVTKRGFVCHKREINFLSASVCGPCHQYEPKATPNEGGNPS